MKERDETSAMVVVSNRLPCRARRGEDGVLELKESSGGLVTALRPLMKQRGGCWLGWPGSDAPALDDEELVRGLDELSEEFGFRLEPVGLSDELVEQYYAGYANAILWPLCHNFPSLAEHDPALWQAYLEANARFARRLEESNQCNGGMLWVHDYHLIPLLRLLRERGEDRVRGGFFLHIPFPTPVNMQQLPQREELLEALCCYDLVGLQSPRDVRHARGCFEAFGEEIEVVDRSGDPGSWVEGSTASDEPQVTSLDDSREDRSLARTQGFVVRSAWGETVFDAFPISVDAESFHALVRSRETEPHLVEMSQAYRGRAMILGVDRLDYSKGLPHRMRAIDRLLSENPSLRGRVQFVQLVVPSRQTVDAYADLKAQLDELCGAINARHGEPGWQPIEYFFRGVPRERLVAMYHRADVALVTPLRDGMNLVAKEYCVCQPEEDPGVLILGEGAGAASQLGEESLVVNPNDEEAMVRALLEALSMPLAERQRRMSRLAEGIERDDVHRWAERYLSTLQSCHARAAGASVGSVEAEATSVERSSA